MSTSAAPTADTLARIALFQETPRPILAELASRLSPQTLSSGDYVFRREDQGAGLVIVLDGLLQVEIADANGRVTVLALITAGETVGELSLIDGAPRNADVVAALPSRVLTLSRAAFLQAMDSEPALARSLLVVLTRRLRETSERLVGANTRSLEQRLALAVLKVAAADPAGLVRFTQQQLATIAGGTRPKVNNYLRRFVDKGWLEVARAGYRIKDAEALQLTADAGQPAERQAN